jgi:mono/diheme cytochrome c family protein
LSAEVLCRIAAVPRAALPLLVLLLACGFVVAGCGAGTEERPVAETVIGTLATTTTSGPSLPKGNAAAGKSVFASAGCGGCHTLKAAGSTGNVGPNLDQLKPSLSATETQVENGGGGMPAFKDQLSDKQIADVSQFVYTSTH